MSHHNVQNSFQWLFFFHILSVLQNPSHVTPVREGTFINMIRKRKTYTVQVSVKLCYTRTEHNTTYLIKVLIWIITADY